MTNDQSKKIKVGIVGGAGYTAGELLRLLINHPEVELKWVVSSSHAGHPVTEVHGGLIGDCELTFDEAPRWDEVDAVFLCSGHGQSRAFLEANALPSHVKIIDLSQDYRDESDGFVYGLPEANGQRIKKASRLANPGCFATAIQLSLLPLAASGNLVGDVHVTAVTGSTGAGVKPSATTHFSWRNDNLSVYKAFEHQHLAEIIRTLKGLEGETMGRLSFVPERGDFARGLFALT